MPKILHIEDDPANRLLVRKLLTPAGFEVVDAADGLDGIRKARSERPDLVLIDIAIPGLDGYEVTLRLRAEPELVGVPIVAVTAEGNRETSLAVGADGSIYVTDTGLRMGAGRMQASETEAVYRILPGGRMQTLARGPELGSPNGIVVDADGGVTVAGMNSSEVYRLAGGSRTLLRAPRRGLLDGLVRTRGGALLVSDWKRSAAYRIHPDAEPVIALRKLPSPADIGYDARRNRLLVPMMTVNRLEFHPAP